MTMSHRYADFGEVVSTAGALSNGESTAFEDAKLQSFENGYQAGWDDAVQAQQSEQDKLAAEFAQNFQDLSFTYHEASAKLIIALRPLIDGILAKLLPHITQNSLNLHIAEHIQSLVAANIEKSIEIAVSPDNYQVVSDTLATQVSQPFVLTAEPALSAGQVYLRVNQAEREILLDDTMADIKNAFDAFFQQAEQDMKYG